MRNGYLGSVLAAAALFAVAAVTGPALAAETKGPVTDEIGVIKITPGEPIQIGVYTVLSGPDAALGIDQLRGVRVRVADEGGELLGHRIKLIDEDAVCSAEGGQTAATKLAANQKVVLVIGAACSSATVPGAPILWNAGIVSIGISPTAPMLTATDRPDDYDGFVRVVWNDSWAGRDTAVWAYEVEGARTAAAIHDGSPYAQGLAEVFATNFAELGGTITSVEGITPTDVDMMPMLTKIATDKPDIIFYPTFVAATAHITRQALRINGLEDTILLGADGALVPSFIELAGNAALNFRMTSNDLSEETLGVAYPAFLASYVEMFGETPIAGFHHFAHDAAMVGFEAIKAVAVTDDAGNLYIGRKALRDAVFATAGLEGLTGTKTCGETGDCGQFNFTIYQWHSTTEPFELGKNPRKIWPAD